MAPKKVAVVTGGHSFDVPAFHNLFRDLPDLDVYIQHMDDFASASEQIRDSYSCILFYTMLKKGPVDEGLEWYQGKQLSALTRITERGQGIVMLHHALLAFPEWKAWKEMTGIHVSSFEYDMDQSVNVYVSDPDHPITRELSPWVITDETYLMAEPEDTSHILLRTDHPRCVQALAWTRNYRESKIFCYQSGHDATAWNNDEFRSVLARGIDWVTG